MSKGATVTRRTPPKSSVRGRLQRPHTVEATAARLSRTLRVPLLRPDDDTLAALRAYACQATRYGNRVLAGQYIARTDLLDRLFERIGLAEHTDRAKAQLENVLYAYMNDELSGWTRNAMKQNKCRGYWKRSGRNVAAGRERLACFSADRALSIQADQASNQGALYEYRDGVPVLVCRFGPASTHDPIVLPLDIGSVPARRDRFIREAVDAIWSGKWKPGIVTLRFDRVRRKVDALISYTKPVVIPEAGERTATLGPLADDQLWLRGDDGTNVDFSDRVRRLRDMKEHFAGIHRRLRRGAGRGAGRRQAYRRALVRAGDFSTWAEGPLHQWSAAIVKAAQDMGAGRIALYEISDADLPWHRLSSLVRYKAEEVGIEVVDPTLEQPASVRAKQSGVRKLAQRMKRTNDALRTISELLSSEAPLE